MSSENSASAPIRAAIVSGYFSPLHVGPDVEGAEVAANDRRANGGRSRVFR